MGTRKELLQHLWHEVIDVKLREEGLNEIVRSSKRDANTPFADAGPAIERIIAAGAAGSDLCLVLRAAAYETVFATLYSLNDPGVDGDDVFMLHEELLVADPSGMEGRPGSAAKSRR